MEWMTEIVPVATIETEFKEKFGIPRQCGLVPELRARVVFRPEYSTPDAIRGIEAFSHLWLIFGFSGNMIRPGDPWAPLVRPPRLGGREKVGVFASRSPYRPNSLGLSSVRLIEVDRTDPAHPALIVGGADLLDGTPIYDIKPYIPYSDCHEEAETGYSVERKRSITVDFPESLLARVETSRRAALIHVLEQDPRGAYEKKPGYLYGMRFDRYDVRFTVEEEILRVTDVVCDDAPRVK